MNSDDFYEGRATVPIDRVAARVTGRGEHYIAPLSPVLIEYENPLPLVDAKEWATISRQSSFADLRGVRKGRLTVIGMLAGGSGWLCRCSCGHYVVRTAKSIKKARDGDKQAHCDACYTCRHVMFLKREEHYRRTGKDLDGLDMYLNT